MTQIIRTRTCSSCKFIDRSNEMRCHRRAPAVHPVLQMTSQGPRLAGDVTLFPSVNADMWCGEWEQRIMSAADAPVAQLREAN